jgi:hypothetical protein
MCDNLQSSKIRVLKSINCQKESYGKMESIGCVRKEGCNT